MSEYTRDMYYVLIYYQDSCNKQQRTLAQITFQHKLTIYKLHYDNAYSDEKEPKRRDTKMKKNLKNEDKRNKRKKKRNND